MSHIFISYAREDRAIALRIEKELRKAKRKGWLDASNILGGQNWRDEIDQAIRTSRAVILILSPAASKSEYVTYEWAYALGVGKRVVPLLVKKTKLHPRLEALQYLDFTLPQKRWGQLIEQVTAHKLTTKGLALEPSAGSSQLFTPPSSWKTASQFGLKNLIEYGSRRKLFPKARRK